MPSADITAAVAGGKIIMWHVNEKPWNGERAATMYKALGKALRKNWGVKSSYRVIEDGDTKSFQSGKGVRAKQIEKIRSWKLPPRTPEWMPLDYCLWTQIEQRVLAKTVGDESFKSYRLRLLRTAQALPKRLVTNALLDMRPRIRQTLDSKGAHIKKD